MVPGHAVFPGTGFDLGDDFLCHGPIQIGPFIFPVLRQGCLLCAAGAPTDSVLPDAGEVRCHDGAEAKYVIASAAALKMLTLGFSVIQSLRGGGKSRSKAAIRLAIATAIS